MQNNPKHQIAVEITAERALFADPLSKVGGEKLSYQIPTYEALKGLIKGIYWKPTISWYIDAVRVMNPIQMETECSKIIKMTSRDGDLAFSTYLTDVRYQVLAHYEWNENRPEFAKDRDFKKYNAIIGNMINIGGRDPLYLGTRECTAYVAPCVFGDGAGHYDHAGTQVFGNMYHGITYPDEYYDEKTKGRVTTNFFNARMENGIITFPRPEECPIHNYLHKQEMKPFDANKDEKKEA